MKYLFLGIAFILAGICFACLGFAFHTIPNLPLNNLFAIFSIAFSLLFLVFGIIISIGSIYLKK